MAEFTSYTGDSPGTTTDAPTNPATIENPTGNTTTLSQSALDQFAAQYGYAAYWLTDPEIGPILKAAAAEGWSADTLQSALAKTDFYTKHTQAQRDFQMRLHDPMQQATLAMEIRNAASDVITTARKMGVRISQDRANQIAYDGVQNGFVSGGSGGSVSWDSNQLNTMVYNEGKRAEQTGATMGTGLVNPETGRTAYSGPNGEPGYGGPQPGAVSWQDPSGKTVWYMPGAAPDPGNVQALKAYQPGKDTQGAQIAPGGDAQAYAQRLQARAHEYLVPLDDKTALQYGLQIAAGQATEAGIESMFSDQAKGRFATSPDIQKALGQGITPAQFLSPYQQTIARQLEISPDAVDFSNPKYAGVLSYADPKTGTPRMMTLSEADTWARSQPEWDQTKNARDAYSTMAKDLSTEMGMAKY